MTDPSSAHAGPRGIAGVLAGDPGSAVLTLTSFGMAQRSRPSGFGRSPVVALWKGPGQETREIPLERGAQGILLSASAARAAKRSFDGRRPLQNGSEFSSVSVRQVRASRTGSGPPDAPPGAPSRPVLEADELTILTSWAEAVADALVFAPQRIEAVPAAAQAGAPWRAELRIPEPSPSLNRAISGIVRAVRRAAATGSDPSLDALLHAIGNSQPYEPTLDRLVRAVLRSALEQSQARQADEGGALARTSLLPPGSPAEARPPSSTHGHRVTQHRRELEYADADTAGWSGSRVGPGTK